MTRPPTTSCPKRQLPGVARNKQLARTIGTHRNPDLSAMPLVYAGDLWALGHHRLLCGDCTRRDAVSTLMGVEIADLMVTDPPYGVRYTGKKLVRKAIKNDDLTGEQFRGFLLAAFRSAPLKPGGCFYICAPSNRMLESFLWATAEAGLDVKQALVWMKNHFVLSRSDYHSKHEVLLYGWKPGAPHYYSGDRRQHSIWEFPKPQRSPFHPTSKPIALLERTIVNNSREGEMVYDGFVGGGSTLIACESTGRRCRALEIEPQYVAVTIARWEQITGKRADLMQRVVGSNDDQLTH